jgi:hypothetical protein
LPGCPTPDHVLGSPYFPTTLVYLKLLQNPSRIVGSYCKYI